jgi:hypothetical protein
MHLHRIEADRLVLEHRREVPLRIDVDDQDPTPVLRGQERDRGRDAALADTALPRDEEQPACEEVVSEVQRRQAGRNPTRFASWSASSSM